MFWLLIRICLEVGIAAGPLLFVSLGFWQPVRSRRLTRKYCQDQGFLNRFIQNLDAESSFSERAEKLEQFRGDWAWNMLLVTNTNVQSLSILRTLNLVIALLLVAGSYFLEPLFAAVNVAVFLLWALLPATGAASQNALTEILSMAQISFRWRRDDPAGYREFLSSATGLAKIDVALDQYAT